MTKLVLAEARVWSPMQIKQLMTRPLSRTFEPLRRIEPVEPGAGYNITPPPQLGEPKVTLSVHENVKSQCSKFSAPPLRKLLRDPEIAC